MENTLSNNLQVLRKSLLKFQKSTAIHCCKATTMQSMDTIGILVRVLMLVAIVISVSSARCSRFGPNFASEVCSRSTFFYLWEVVQIFRGGTNFGGSIFTMTERLSAGQVSISKYLDAIGHRIGL